MPADREQVLARLRQFPDRLVRLVEPQSREDLTRAGPDGSWGAIEILAYLRDRDQVNLERFHQILTEDTPTLETYDADLWAIERDYHAQDPAAVLADFHTLRQRLVAALERAPNEAWQRRARHPERGVITLTDLVREIDAEDQARFRALRDVLL